MKTRFLTLLLLVGSLVGAGCSVIPPAGADPTRFYVLSAAPASATKSESGEGLVLGLRSVDVAAYLRSRSLVVRQNGNEVQFRDFARWGEPLEAGLSRTLKEALIATGSVSQVASVPFSIDVERDLDLSVRVLACEGGADGSVYFRATWELVNTGAGAGLLASGDFTATGLTWDGQSEATLASALSEAVATLGKEIATKINAQ